jgi:hypothetical protein
MLFNDTKKLLTLPSKAAVTADLFITKTKTKIKESTTISAADKQSHTPTRIQHFTHMHEIHAVNTPSLTIPFTVFLLCMHAYLKTYKVTTLISFILTLQVLQNALLPFQSLSSYTPSSRILNIFDGHAHSITLNAFALSPATILDEPNSSFATLDLVVSKPKPASTLDTALTMLDVSSLLSPTLDMPGTTMLDTPVLLSTTMEKPAKPIYLINSDSTRPRNLGYIALGPSNPHDPGPTAAVASRIAAQNDIIAHNMSPFIHFTIYDYLRTPPRSPQ